MQYRIHCNDLLHLLNNKTTFNSDLDMLTRQLNLGGLNYWAGQLGIATISHRDQQGWYHCDGELPSDDEVRSCVRE